MARDQSVAPKERVNITFKSATGGEQAEVELPLKMLVVGDYSRRDEALSIEERKPINIDKDNFNDVLAEQRISVALSVPNHLSGEPGACLDVNLPIRSIKDFSPDAIAENVPELRKLLELRAALTAVKGPLGNVPAFRKRLQNVLGDASAREHLSRELGLLPGDSSAESASE